MSYSLSLGALAGPWHMNSLDLATISNFMLAFVLGGMVILAMPLFLGEAALTERRDPTGAYPYSKLACGLLLILVQGASITIRYNSSDFCWDLLETAAILSFTASVGTFMIIFASCAQTLQTPTLLNVFLLLTTPFDIGLALFHFLSGVPDFILALQASVVILKLTFTTLQETPRDRSPCAGVFFNWINALFVIVWRNDCTLDDLPIIGKRLSSEELLNRFNANWGKVDQSSNNALLFTLLFIFKRQFVVVGLLHLVIIGLTVWQPFLILAAVEGHFNKQSKPHSPDFEHLAMYCVMNLLALAITRDVCEYWIDHIIASARSMVVAAAYSKMQRLTVEDLETIDTISLIKIDIQGIEQIAILANEIFWCISHVVAGVWACHTFTGPASFLITLPALGILLVHRMTSKIRVEARGKWHAAVATRGALTSNVLAQLGRIKAMSLCRAISNYLEKALVTERDALLRERHTALWLFAETATMWAVSPVLVLAGAYFWTRAEDLMSIAEVFATLSALTTACYPMAFLTMYIGRRGKSLRSMAKLQAFLTLDECTNLHKPQESIVGDFQTATLTSGIQRPPLAVELRDVSVTSTSEGPLLRQINMRISWGALVMMWGPMKCGKSTLMKLLLGEVALNTGTVSIGSRVISYCSQDFWIPDCTLLEAIIGGIGFIASRYNAVIRACGLDVDIATLLRGEQTQTGVSGSNLSASQRERLTIARAVYAQSEIMVLDNMFSQVSPEMASQVFDRLFGPNGMVRHWNCTVVMVTNRLELLDFADQIYQFTSDGRIEQQDSSSSGSTSGDVTSSHHGSSRAPSAATAISESGVTSTTDATVPSQATGTTVVRDVGLPRAGAAVEEHNRPVIKHATFFDLVKYARALGSVGFLPIICWISLLAIASIGQFSTRILPRVWWAEDPAKPNIIFGFVMVSVFCVIMNVISGAFYFAFVLPGAGRMLHQRLLEAVMQTTPQFLRDINSGLLHNRLGPNLSFDCFQLGLLANRALFGSFDVILETFLTASGSIYASSIVAYVLLGYCVIQVTHLRGLRQSENLQSAATSALTAHIAETTSGIQHIRSFGWQTTYCQRLYSKLDRSEKARFQVSSISRWLNFSLDIIAAAVCVALFREWSSHPDRIPAVVLGLSISSVFVQSLTASLNIKPMTRFIIEMNTVRQINEFLTHTPREQDLAALSEPPQSWPSEGRLDFNALTATYTNMGAASYTALNRVTITIQAGQKVGIMGHPGSGKTTFLSSILRMVDYTGSVSIDQLDIRTVSREVLRSRITTITQDGLQIDSTLRFNLYPYDGPQPSNEDMIAALHKVNLWTYANRHGGLDAEYSSLNFSAVERQFMYLARASLHHSMTGSKIVLIDAPSTAMTAAVEEDIQWLIDDSFTDCTVLAVSNSLEYLNNADMVLQFDGGMLETAFRRRRNGQLVEIGLQ